MNLFKPLKEAFLCASIFILLSGTSMAQSAYRYSVDLTDVKNDQLKVELLVPKVSSPDVTFFLPKIIPGTYSNADYGKFVHAFKAYDKAGKELPVTHPTENSWKIKSGGRLHRIVYEVEDTWESLVAHQVYDMAGTNIEAGKNFVINPPGVFGYIDGMKKVPFEVTIRKPEGMYGSTPLKAKQTSKENDVYVLTDADHLYDSPIMYNVPDTTVITLGSTEVLISVYSPKKLVTSKAIAESMKEMLTATQDYLGGKLPVDKYAFIYYFNGEQAPLKRTGALEHNYSSFYALPEYPYEDLAPTIFDISAHEFFHVVTPLTISSREVKEFNFNEPVLSRHLWLYEGTTEYHSDHVQVVAGIITPEEFLAKITEKIAISRKDYNDNLSFTELSLHSADKHQDQYGNVYEKGALIAMTLDIYLYKLSNGKYGLRNLKHDLGIKYGKDSYFKDEELFDVIGLLTYPEIREFFKTHVEGSTPIPYEKYLGMAGVAMINNKSASLGNIQLGGTPDGFLVIGSTANMNAMGKQLGYQDGDQIVSINGEAVTIESAQQVLGKYKATAKEGDPISIVVKRKNASGSLEEKTLQGKVQTTDVLNLGMDPNATPEQIKIRNAWLETGEQSDNIAPPVKADPKDVAELDSIVKVVYTVLSGPAGDRDWNRFRSLFHPTAYMGAVVPAQEGTKLMKFTPEEYIKMNAPHFKQYGFYEKELNRVTNTFGQIAQVFSTYEYTLETPQTVKQRGINSMNLIRENDRWWVLSIVWDEEKANQPIPEKYLAAPVAPAKKKKK